MKHLAFSILTTLLVGLTPGQSAYAQINADYSALPPESDESPAPTVMLSLSRDHQYFFKAYNDFTDLDPENPLDIDPNGNPIVETTYKHSFDYFGYFDSYKCYTRASSVFVPNRITADKYCSGNQWSGNFLNWATMTRMDIVRSIFYGGSRSVDTASRTVLERAFLPHDAHSFAKYYNGRDIGQLTPFDTFRKNGDAGDPDRNLDNANEGITICNTTAEASGTSQASTSAPLMRIAEGNYQLWASNERWQCTWDNERGNQNNSNVPPSNPIPAPSPFAGLSSGIDANVNDPSPAAGRELEVRVEVCVDGLVGRERCKRYPNGNLKPTGILQTYGDDGLINFGLMTGSYQNNIEGGVLRKNTGTLRDEVDALGNGRFIFTNASDSIIKTLEKLRPWGYSYGDGTYIGGGDVDDCPFQLTDVPNGRCNSWGNPISEVFKETIRYMAGLSPTASFDANDTTFIPGLTDDSWEDPLSNENQCSDLNTILINASVSSYDNDNSDVDDVPGGINGVRVDPTASITNPWTDRVGAQEGIHGNEFFIGRTAGDTDEYCTAKTISNLSAVGGLCPEAPTVDGSFGMAGIAYYAHNNDIRPDLEGNQTVNTFAISLATNVPIIKVPRTDGGQIVEILPAYRLFKGSGEGGGALVDFKIVKPHTEVRSGVFEASYYVNWEDSEQGGDYDQDMWGTINYVLDQSTNQITISTTTFAQSTVDPQLFGFVTNGTTTDGFHAFSGILGANYTDPFGTVPGCTNCRALSEGADPTTSQQGPQSHTFSIAPSNTGNLESPLFYAAKYGGFEESLAVGEEVSLTDEPDEVTEWDSTINATGLAGSDGLPDNFFFVINPENLFNSLEQALNKILSEDVAASAAVASFANSNGFENIIIQGTYQAQRRGRRNNQFASVNWTGEIFSFFIDEFGLFRQDNPTSGTPGQLDCYSTDKAFRYNTENDEPRVQYFDVPLDPNFPAADCVPQLDANLLPVRTEDGAPQPLGNLQPLWDGGEKLRSINNARAVDQRPYNAEFADNPTTNLPSRYIFTYIDSNLNGRVDAGEQIDFTRDEIDNSNFSFFGQGNEADADAIVDYIRGFDAPDATGFRNRTLDRGADEVVYRLGDLVNSTPKVVAGASEAYDTRFGDDDYAIFRDRYKDRRQVAYVGANDGLLHAFNVGFRDPDDRTVEYSTTSGTKTAHPLGAELWAYAPYNLLPHLQWLTSSFYNHVFYVDGSPEAYDVKIFTPSNKHPGGWGTILVVGMRLGGGDYPLNTPGGNTVARSAYVVLDVTDPESPPTVLAEISDPDLNLTTSKPDIFYDCENFCNPRDNDIQNNFDGKWQLVFGSGPNNLKTFTTDENAKVFAYDLKANVLVKEDVTTGVANTPVNRSFVGSVSSRDWDNGLNGYRNDDVVYFGTVGTLPPVGAADPVETGAIYRYRPSENRNKTSLMFNAQRPVVQAPVTISRDSIGNDILGSWVYFGTGIYLQKSNETIDEQERFYGLLETYDATAIANLDGAAPTAAIQSFEDSSLLTYQTIGNTDLVDVSNVDVRPDGTLVNAVPAIGAPTPVDTFEKLGAYILTQQGWRRDLPTGAVANDPSSRVSDGTVAFADQLFFTAFRPDTLVGRNICLGTEGISEVFAINQTTGTASPFATFGVTPSASGDIVNTSAVIGTGNASAPLIFTSEALGSNQGVIISQRGDGSLTPGTDPTGNGGLGETNALRDVKISRSGWREILQ